MSNRRLARSNAMAVIPDGSQSSTTHSAAPTTSSRKRKVAVVLSASENEDSGTPTVINSDSDGAAPPSPAGSEHMEVTPPPTRGRSARMSTGGRPARPSTARNAVSASPVDNRVRKRQKRRGEDPALEQESPTPGATAAALSLESLDGPTYRAKHKVVVVEIPVKRGRGRPRKANTTTTKLSKGKEKARSDSLDAAPSTSTSGHQNSPKQNLEQDEFIAENQVPSAPPPFSITPSLGSSPASHLLPSAPLIAATPTLAPVPTLVGTLPPVGFVGPPFWKKRHEQTVNGYTLYIGESSLSDLMASNPEDFQCAMMIKTFTRSGIYVNFGRIHPDAVGRPAGDKSFLALTGFKQPVVGIMLGLVLCSYLRTNGPGPEKTDGSCSTVKNLCVCPFSDFLQQSVSVWSSAYANQDPIVGPCTPTNGIVFMTKQKDDPVRKGAQGLSNAINKSYGRPKSRFITVDPTASTSMDYPVVQPLEAHIPVYDGRASAGRPFNATDDSHWANLRSRAQYTEELKLDDVVLVGHTVNRFGNNPEFPPILNLNIQFAIILFSSSSSSESL
ncbi:hypothetical protein BDN72DRAFT_905943 [Pluteus cervinus]|uniref:Uncharacterized protein n=1 Tax=Pluteus cervinus TaxID=181527 RepID=A0ACD3A0Y4_9AGAR|nr:hypothetical protein BDN72DRAFT_905943 [Pluteus cervinus]